MKATLVREAFDSPDHLFEIKWDGIRAIAFAGGKTRLQSRTLRDITPGYPELSSINKLLAADEAILDGEIVALDPLGRSSFELLQQRMNLTRATDIAAVAHTIPAVYFVFDLLYLDGRPILDLPLTGRRDLLYDLFERSGLLSPSPATSFIRLSETIDAEGSAFFEAARLQGLEGIVAKRKLSIYQPGKRGRDWLKVKTVQTGEFVIGGWTEGAGGRSSTFGALLLGIMKDGRLIYAGHVGTGFDDRSLAEVLGKLSDKKTTDCPFSPCPSTNTPAHWVTPDLTAKIEFLEWTNEGQLRAPSFKGLI